MAVATKKPNWRRMAEAARNRRAELGWTQDELIREMVATDKEHAISIETVRRIEAGDQSSYRRPTLAAYSKGVGWPAGALWEVAHGGDPPSEVIDPAYRLPTLQNVHTRLDLIEAQIDRILAVLELGHSGD